MVSPPGIRKHDGPRTVASLARDGHDVDAALLTMSCGDLGRGAEVPEPLQDGVASAEVTDGAKPDPGTEILL